METTKKGWIVISETHPNSKEMVINEESFAFTKKDSISKFSHGSDEKWGYWKEMCES